MKKGDNLTSQQLYDWAMKGEDFIIVEPVEKEPDTWNYIFFFEKYLKFFRFGKGIGFGSFIKPEGFFTRFGSMNWILKEAKQIHATSVADIILGGIL